MLVRQLHRSVFVALFLMWVAASPAHARECPDPPYCPSGYTLEGQVACVKRQPPSCAPGFREWPEGSGSCLKTATPDCPPGFVFKGQANACLDVEPGQCPAGLTLNQGTGVCEASASPSCPTGMSIAVGVQLGHINKCGVGQHAICDPPRSYDATKKCCTASEAPTCPPDTSYSATLKRCRGSTPPICPNGYTRTDQQCKCHAGFSCQAGYSFHGYFHECAKVVGTSEPCPSGTTWYSQHGECLLLRDPICQGSGVFAAGPYGTFRCCAPDYCPAGYWWSNASHTSCKKVSSPICPSGYTFSASDDMCWASEEIPQCAPSFKWYNDFGTCARVADASCKRGFTLRTNVCEKEAAVICPPGLRWVTEHRGCAREEAPSCDSPATYDTQSRKCRATRMADVCASPTTYEASSKTCRYGIRPTCQEGCVFDSDQERCVEP